MKYAFVLAPLLLAVAPARADFLQGFFGATDARTATHFRKPFRNHRHGGFSTIRGAARPAGAFVALASYYGGFGERLNAYTASGERFRAGGLTAAHRTLPFGTHLLVSRAGRSVVVRVNDRGPSRWTGRGLDLSRGAAAQLGMLEAGVARVRVAILD